MNLIAGAILLVGALALGPQQTANGWEVYTGLLIVLGFLLVLASLFGDGDR